MTTRMTLVVAVVAALLSARLVMDVHARPYLRANMVAAPVFEINDWRDLKRYRHIRQERGQTLAAYHGCIALAVMMFSCVGFLLALEIWRVFERYH
jgi:hypothetical protein